jgi:hypothetical protein
VSNPSINSLPKGLERAALGSTIKNFHSSINREIIENTLFLNVEPKFAPLFLSIALSPYEAMKCPVKS